jgi:hypothetical protein
MNEYDTKYKEKLKQLHRIKMILVHLSKKEQLTESPKTHDALQASMLITLIDGALGFALDQINENYFLFLLVAVFLIVWISTYKKSSRKDTWLEELDSKLMDYEPVDVRSYQHLQQTIANADLTRIRDFCPFIEDWLMVERITIKEILNPEPLESRIANKPKQNHNFKFIDKIVDNKTEQVSHEKEKSSSR